LFWQRNHGEKYEKTSLTLAMKTILLIFTVAACTVASQLLLKKGALSLSGSPLTLSVFLSIVTSPYVISSIILQIFSFGLWFVVLSKTNLGYAIGLSGAFLYLLLPLLSWFIYGEWLSWVQWIGLVLITVGILCLTTKI
jgi:drug/metabolite transporter (DMT)-like permease